MIANVALLGCLSVALWIAVSDLLYRRIPNLLCLFCMIFAGLSAYFAGGWSSLASGAVHALLALLIGMGLFWLKFIGGGDAKFYAAIALAIPLGQALPMLGWTSVSGLVLLVLMVVWRRLATTTENSLASGILVPYGLAITSGFLILTIMEWQTQKPDRGAGDLFHRMPAGVQSRIINF